MTFRLFSSSLALIDEKSCNSFRIEMSSNLTLYYASGSPPCRAVYILAKNLGLEFKVQNVNMMVGEHHSEEFTKLNPLQKIPVLIDGDFVLTESRAIMVYLVDSRKPGSDLYPTDPKARALVDQKLYYDATVVFKALANFAVRIYIANDLYQGND